MSEMLTSNESGFVGLAYLGIPRDVTEEQASHYLREVFGAVQGREAVLRKDFIALLRQLPNWKSCHEVAGDSFDVSNVVNLPDGGIVYIVMSGTIKGDDGSSITSHTKFADEDARRKCISRVVESDKSLVITEYYHPVDVEAARLRCSDMDDDNDQVLSNLRRSGVGVCTQITRGELLERFPPDVAIQDAQTQFAVRLLEETLHHNQGYNFEQQAEISGGTLEQRLYTAKSAINLYVDALEKLVAGNYQGLQNLVTQEEINSILDSLSLGDLLEYAQSIKNKLLDIDSNAEKYVASIQDEIMQLDEAQLQNLMFVCDVRIILAHIDVDEFEQYEDEVRSKLFSELSRTSDKDSEYYSLFRLIQLLRDALIGRARDDRYALTYFRRAKDGITQEQLEVAEQILRQEDALSGEIDEKYLLVFKQLYDTKPASERSLGDIQEVVCGQMSQVSQVAGTEDGEMKIYATYILDEIKKAHLYRIVREEILPISSRMMDIGMSFEKLMREHDGQPWSAGVVELLNRILDISSHHSTENYIHGVTQTLPPEAASVLQRLAMLDMLVSNLLNVGEPIHGQIEPPSATLEK